MKNLILGSLVLGALAWFADGAFGHGGQYRGPRDVVPPGGGSGPGGPSTPSGPSGPSTPSGPSGPSTPSGPTGPTTGPSGPTGGPSGGPTTRGIDITESLDTWTFWWEFNKERFLNLKRAISSVAPTTESDEFYMGILNPGAKDVIGITREKVQAEILPAIREVLADKDRMRDETSSALVALGKFGIDPQQSIQDISKFLDSKDQEIRETAAVALGILAQPEAIPTLKDLLTDSQQGQKLTGQREVDLRTRAFAAYGLGLIGHYLVGDDFRAQRTEVTDLLCEVLRKDSSSVKDIKIACITALGLIPNEDEDVLRVVKDPLMPLLEDTESKNIDLIRAHVPTAMARMAAHLKEDSTTSREWVDAFLKMLNNKREDQYVRQSLVLALGLLVQDGDEDYKKVFSALRKVQEDGRSQQERYFTGIVFGQMGGDDAVNFLLKEVTDGKKLFKPWAALGLGVNAYNLRTKDGGAIDPRVADRINLALQKEKDPSDKGAFAISLGLLRHQASRDLILKELLDTNVESLKGYLGVSLGLMNAPDVLEQIRAEIRKSKRRPEQLQQLSIAAGLLGDKDIVTELVDMMREASTTSVYAALAQALGFIGDQRSIAPLVELVKNKKDLTGEARAFAIVALGIVGDKEEFPWNTKVSENMNYRASVTTLTGGAVGILDIL